MTMSPRSNAHSVISSPDAPFALTRDELDQAPEPVLFPDGLIAVSISSPAAPPLALTSDDLDISPESVQGGMTKACERGDTHELQRLLHGCGVKPGDSPIIPGDGRPDPTSGPPRTDGLFAAAVVHKQPRVLSLLSYTYPSFNAYCEKVMRPALEQPDISILKLLQAQVPMLGKYQFGPDSPSPLMEACRTSHSEVILYLIDVGCELNDQRWGGPLGYAVKHGQPLWLLKEMVERGAVVKGMHVWEAILKDRLSVLQFLLPRSLRSEAREKKAHLELARERGNTQIIDLVENFIEQHAPLVFPAQEAMIRACKSGNFAWLEQLLQGCGEIPSNLPLGTPFRQPDPDPNLGPPDTWRLLTIAVARKRTDIVLFLLEYYPLLTLDRDSVLDAAFANRDHFIFRALHAHDPQIATYTFARGSTSLIEALRYSRSMIPHFLLDNGADPTVTGGHVEGALVTALHNHQPLNLIKKLVKHGAEVSAAALFAAIRYERIDVLDFFLPKCEPAALEEALEFAQEHNNADVVDLLTRFARKDGEKGLEASGRGVKSWWKVGRSRA